VVRSPSQGRTAPKPSSWPEMAILLDCAGPQALAWRATAPGVDVIPQWGQATRWITFGGRRRISASRNPSISIVRLLSIAMASSSSGSISMYCPLPTS
jgi:hypothetical protein